MTDNLPITKKEFLDAIIPFVEKYKRLPYMEEDDVEVPVDTKNEDGEVEQELRPYRAARYITAFFETLEGMNDYLLENEILTYDVISEITGLTETIARNIITITTQNPNGNARRSLNNLFGKDFYEGYLSAHSKKCGDCTSRTCKQSYWVDVVRCPKFKEKK